MFSTARLSLRLKVQGGIPEGRESGALLRFPQHVLYLRHGNHSHKSCLGTAIFANCDRSLFLGSAKMARSEEHTSELQSRFDLVCRLLLEKKKKTLPSGRVCRQCA